MQATADASVQGWRSALEHWGLEPCAARRVKRGRNTHWVIRTPTERLILRRYHANCTQAEVAYEHAILKHLKGRGWPVAVPVSEVLHSPLGMWCLFSYVPGRQRTLRTARGRYAEEVERGRLLARLHADLAGITHLGQRDGWLTTPEGVFARPGRPSARSVLTAFAEQDGERGRLLLTYHEWASQHLGALPVGDAPLSIVHGDFTPWNMRYVGGKLSGIFDFDSSHLDLRIADFVLSWRGSYQGVIDGYNDVTPLSDAERALLIPVFWTFMVSCAVAGIEQGETPDWSIKQLRKHPLEA